MVEDAIENFKGQFEEAKALIEEYKDQSNVQKLEKQGKECSEKQVSQPVSCNELINGVITYTE